MTNTLSATPWRNLARELSLRLPRFRSAEVPVEPRFVPRDPWPGDTQRGEALLRRRDTLLKEIGAHAGRDGHDERWLTHVHSFTWLRDLRALGGDDARRLAREAATTFIRAHGRRGDPAWEAGPLGDRIVAWLGNFDFFAASADDGFRMELLDSVVRQAGALRRLVSEVRNGSDGLAIAHGLIATGAALPGSERLFGAGLDLLPTALDRGLLPDGGHPTRSPSRLLATTFRLIDLRMLITAAGSTPPARLVRAIESTAPALRFFRHGDGGLALFNNGAEEDGWAVDLALTQAGGKPRTPQTLPDSGFERMTAGRSVVIVDAGRPPPAPWDRVAHAGTLAFEFSVGRERLVTNCGAYLGPEGGWSAAQRATAAHSTLELGELSSSGPLPDGGFDRRVGLVTHERRDEAGAAWLDLAHDGYSGPLGTLPHRRRLYLAPAGDDLRGEDRIEGGAGQPFTLRFHLHPGIQTSLVENGAAVLLRLPGGAGWRFRASGGSVGLSESVYLGQRGHVRRTEQIVVEGTVGSDGARLRWAFQALARR